MVTTKVLSSTEKAEMSDVLSSFGRNFHVDRGSIDEYDGKKILNFGISRHDVSRANQTAMAKKIAESGLFKVDEIHYGGVCVWSAAI